MNKFDVSGFLWIEVDLLFIAGNDAYYSPLQERNSVCPVTNQAGNFPCSQCDRVFTNYMMRLFHVESVHMGLIFTCILWEGV